MKITNFANTFSQCCEHKLLVASPSLKDTYFENALIYICVHSPSDGAFGVIVNKEMAVIGRDDIIDASNYRISKSIMERQYPVVIGGPLQEDTISFLYLHHESQDDAGEILEKKKALLYTEADYFIKILQKATKKAKFLVVRGITSWMPGQLENELLENSWVVAEPDYDLIFSRKYKDLGKWKLMVRSLGLEHTFQNIVGYCGTA